MLKRSVNTKQCREKGLQTLRQLLARQYSKYLYKWLQEVSVEKQTKKLPTDNSLLFCDESRCNYFLYDKLHLRAIRELCSNFIHARTDGTVSEATEEILIVTTVYFNTHHIYRSSKIYILRDLALAKPQQLCTLLTRLPGRLIFPLCFWTFLSLPDQIQIQLSIIIQNLIWENTKVEDLPC